MNDNICLALSVNYPITFLHPFIKSFQKFADGILYLVTDIPEKHFACYSKIRAVSLQDLYKKYNITANLTAFNLKPIIFYLLLKELNQAQKVLISDVDVIFQSNPFDFNTDNNFYICEEKKIFSQCEVNLTWLKVSYPEYEQALLQKRILNSGVVYGARQTIQNYFKFMIGELQNLLPRCNYPILDQIILNILYYVRGNIEPIILPHNNKHIVHLSQEDKSIITTKNIDNTTFVLNNNISTVVHQYNKQPFLDTFFKQLYA